MASSSINDKKRTVSALEDSYNDQIRPLLDAVDKLRELKVMNEGIQLPTIVVVGDQSSGKSSVLESLAGISLPRGDGICTRVPLIMRLQSDCSTASPEFSLEHNGEVEKSNENTISTNIESFTAKIAGSGNGISDSPLTLVVRKKGVPDLTLIDLPGITRVPVFGQPKDIYEQVSRIIMKYIQPEESIILNVIQAGQDFSTCESILMSQKVDTTGLRTLAAITKVDTNSEGLLKKVTDNVVNIGLGYICVRNRIGSETYEEAREEEARLFESHPHLSGIDKSMVGIPVLARKLMQIQAKSIEKCLPDIVRKLNEKLSSSMSDLDGLPQNLTSVADGMRVFMQIMSKSKEMLKKLLIRGEFEDFPNDKQMHGASRLAEKLNQYELDLLKFAPNFEDFLSKEIAVLEETKGIGLPNFLPRSAFSILLQENMKKISGVPLQFITDVWKYVEDLVVQVLSDASENYPTLKACVRSAAHNLIAKMRQASIQIAKEDIEMEMITDYTYNSNYMSSWTELMKSKETFMNEIRCGYYRPINIGTIANVSINHLLLKNTVMLEQAFDLKMRIISYWKIVVPRLADSLAMQILFSMRKLVDFELEAEIFNDVLGGGQRKKGIEMMLEESPMTAKKREQLRKSIQKLKEAKEVVAKVMDRISLNSD